LRFQLVVKIVVLVVASSQAVSLRGQQIPAINSIVNSATFGIDFGYQVVPAVEGLVTIFWSNLSDGIYKVQSIPYAVKLTCHVV
jgi:hypothetical protein